MPWCDAGDLASWAEQNELCFGLEFVLQHEYNSHLKLCKAKLVNCQKCNNSLYPLPAAALYALICGGLCGRWQAAWCCICVWRGLGGIAARLSKAQIVQHYAVLINHLIRSVSRRAHHSTASRTTQMAMDQKARQWRR